jgi:hypothetical protein
MDTKENLDISLDRSREIDYILFDSLIKSPSSSDKEE